MSKDLFDKDRRFEKTQSFQENAILLKTLLSRLSKASGISFTCDPQYNKEYVFLRMQDVKLKHLLDSIANLYGTYWEKVSRKYILRRIHTGAKLTLSLMPPEEREVAKAFSLVREEIEKQPDSVKRSLDFAEGRNSEATLDSLPSSLKAKFNDGMDAYKKHRHTTSKPKAQALLDNTQGVKVGFRATTVEQSALDRLQFHYYKGDSFVAGMIVDIYGQIKKQVKGLDINNPDTRSFKCDRLTKAEVKQQKQTEPSLSELITLNLPKLHLSQILKQISQQAPKKNCIAHAREDLQKQEKLPYRVFREPLHEALDQLCKEAKVYDWELRRGNIVVVHVNDIDD